MTASHAPPATGKRALGHARGSHVSIRRLYEPVRSSKQSRRSLLKTSPRSSRYGEDPIPKVPGSQSGSPGFPVR
eukprot:scaffold235_cov319-Pavlova_lutheri.AAC.6